MIKLKFKWQLKSPIFDNVSDFVVVIFPGDAVWRVYANLCKWLLLADMTVSTMTTTDALRHRAWSHGICCTCCTLKTGLYVNLERSILSRIDLFVEQFTFMHIFELYVYCCFPWKLCKYLWHLRLWWDFSLYFVFPLFLQLFAWVVEFVSHMSQAFVLLYWLSL